jgi:exonuclease SbcD
MKILHTADWHLGKKLDRFSRMEEQSAVLDELCELADEHGVDAVLIAGDLFDTYNPSAEAVELFYRTLKRLAAQGRRAVVAIAGNHDSPDRIIAPDPLARECGIIFSGYPSSMPQPFALEGGIELLRSAPGFIELQLPSCSYPLRLLMTPYANEYRLKELLGHEQHEAALAQRLAAYWTQHVEHWCDGLGVNMLLAHLFFGEQGSDGAMELDDEKPILYIGGAQALHPDTVPQGIQYGALGHLHRCHRVGSGVPLHYSGSLLGYSFAETAQQKCVVLVNAQPNQPVAVQPLPLQSARKLLRFATDSVEGAVQWLEQNPEAYVELTLVLDKYLAADERARLHGAHERLVAIIPEMSVGDGAGTNVPPIDLNLGMEELFGRYFFSRFGQQPSAQHLSLFREVCATGGME